MKALLPRASARFLLQHPWEIVLTVLGVAMGVGVMVSIDLAIQSSREAFRVSTESVAGRATHQVLGNGSGVPDSLFAVLRLEAGVRTSAPVVEGFVTSPALPARPLRILGVDPLSEGPFRPYLLGGAEGVNVTDLLAAGGGVFVGRELATDLDASVGGTFGIEVDGRDVGLGISGILTPRDEISRRGIRDVLVMDVSRAQELLGMEGRLSRIDLVLDEAGPGPGEDELREAFGPGVQVVRTGSRSASLSEMIRAFDLNLTALSLLALIFGMFLIYNTMTFSVVQRRPILGSLRSLGVTRREILGLVLGEAAVLGLVGTGLGLLLGVIMGRGMVHLVSRTINDLYFVLSVEGLSVPPMALVKGGVVGLAATLLASLPPALEATLSPARSTLTRSVLEEKARRAVPRAAGLGLAMVTTGSVLLLVPTRSILLAFAALFGLVMGMALLTPLSTALAMRILAPAAKRSVGILGAMAARGVVTAMSRTAPAVAALVVAVSVTVGLGTMIASFRGTVASWLDATLQADVYVSLPGLVSSRPQGTLEPELARRLMETPGLEGASTYRETRFRTERGSFRGVALDLHPRGEAAFTFKEGAGGRTFEAFREGEGLLLSESLAYRERLLPGDTLRLSTEGEARSFPVAGVFYDYGSDRGVIMMSRATFDRYWSDDGITSLGLFAAEGVEVDALVAELQARAADPAVGADGGQAVRIRSNRAIKSASLEIFDRTFAITGVLRLLAFVVAFVGVLSALMALQLERARELAVLRANGLTPGQVWKLVTAQTGLMGLVAGVLAVPAGLVLALVMVFVVNKRSFGWTLQLQVGPEILLQAVALAVLGALLAGIVPAWRMSRTSPAAALREE